MSGAHLSDVLLLNVHGMLKKFSKHSAIHLFRESLENVLTANENVFILKRTFLKEPGYYNPVQHGLQPTITNQLFTNLDF
jgi:hypothetical protein